MLFTVRDNVICATVSAHSGNGAATSFEEALVTDTLGQPETDYERVQNSAEFQALKRRFRRFVFPMTAFFLSWYFLYVLLADYAHDFMAKEVFGNVNVGILLGLGQFASTFLITTLYVRYANKNLDPVAEEIRHDLEGSY